MLRRDPVNRAVGATASIVAGSVVALATASYGVCSWCYRRRLRRDGVDAMLMATTTPDEEQPLDDERSIGEEPPPAEQQRLAGAGPRSPERPSAVAIGPALDLVGASLAIVVCAPLMAAIAIAVKLDDRGPVLFVQERIGRHGQTFRMRKFRTMVVGAELNPIDTVDEHGQSLGPLFNVASDPRATRLGRMLRRTGLDELPQLFNVVEGEMSLVGPRPALPSEVMIFDAGLRRRETVLPGVTGLWQVLAHDNPSLEVYRQLDLYYVDHRCVVGDVAILGWTLGQVLARCVGRRPG